MEPVFSKKVNGPATHALVIGVGHYPHLPGGGATPYANPEGMGQLKSPPNSARAFGRWLIEDYECPERPLATVSMLLAEKNGNTFDVGTNGKPKVRDVPDATMANVAQAIKEWHARGAKNHHNLLIFYFCGHGIAAGPLLSLLMKDFGADPLAPLDGALDFRKFHNAMEECAPRSQCYFVDACRVGSTLIERNEGKAGNSVIDRTGNFVNPEGLLRLGPIFYSTLANAKAYAKPKEPSVFTQALLEAFGGAGSGDEDGSWAVKTSHMQTALTYLMREASRTLSLPLQQIPGLGGDSGEVTLNTLQAPDVPMFVEVDPAEAHLVADLRVEGPVKAARKKREAFPWKVLVKPGEYSIIADFKNAPFKKKQIDNFAVRPPYRKPPLKVTQ